MDYHAIHGHDVFSFDRVLTVSAADADAALLGPSLASSTAWGPTTPVRHVPTGIATLDSILSGSSATDTGAGEVEPEKDRAPTEAEAGTPTEPDLLSTVTQQDSQTQKQKQKQQQQPQVSRRPSSGLFRGQLTEVWGPPGAGKTVFGMQLVANALRAGSSAVWVDCFHSLCSERLIAIMEAQTEVDDGAKSVEEGLAHYACPSLPHFVAMFCSPPSDSTPDIPADASVMVIDSLSALVNYALPRTADKRGTPLMANGKRGPAAHEKRTQVLQYIIAALERLAETRNLAIVLLTQCASRMQSDGGGAALVPAINAVVWDRGIATRLVLFRDWAWKDDETVGGRFVGIQKLNRDCGDPALSHVVAFSITESGLVEEQYSAVPPRWSEFAHKRKLGEAGLGENGDEEDYGWDDEDSMPNMPPQWQGSEDLLLGHQYEDSEEGEEDEDEEGEGQKEDEKGEEEENDGEDVGGDVAEEVGRAIERPGTEAQAHEISKRSLYSVADSEDDSDT